MNPCPCGYLGSDRQYFTCTEKQIKIYKNRVSGPILDRIDILMSLKAVNLKGHHFKGIESSEKVRQRVKVARERQYERYGKEICNGSFPYEQLIVNNPLTNAQLHHLQSLSIKQGLSNRVQIKIIRLVRTIADLKGEDLLSDEVLEEAITLRKINHNSIKSIYSNDLTGEKAPSSYQ